MLVKKTNWTPEEEQFLRDNHGVLTYDAIASKIGRTTRAVQNRASVLGLGRSLPEGWESTNQAVARLGSDSRGFRAIRDKLSERMPWIGGIKLVKKSEVDALIAAKPKNLVSASEMARRLGVGKSTLVTWLHRDRVPVANLTKELVLQVAKNHGWVGLDDEI